jgi:hypothetical protein
MESSLSSSERAPPRTAKVDSGCRAGKECDNRSYHTQHWPDRTIDELLSHPGRWSVRGDLLDVQRRGFWYVMQSASERHFLGLVLLVFAMVYLAVGLALSSAVAYRRK